MAGVSARHAKRRGKAFEWEVRADLERDGYMCITSAGSLGPCDIVAVAPGRVLFVQCKGGVQGRSASNPGLISPDERHGLLEYAHHLVDDPGDRWRDIATVTSLAVVAYQVKEGNRHVLRYNVLTGPTPNEYVQVGAGRPIELPEGE